MILALVVGLVGGAAVALALSALVPARPSLVAIVDALHRPRSGLDRRGADEPARGRLLRTVERSGATRALTASVRCDLRVMGMTPADYVVRRLAWMLAAAAVAPVLAALAVAIEVDVAPGLPVAGSLVLGALGFLVPTVVVRSGARARRSDFAYALSGFVDLLAVALAGGLGVDEALERCAGTGQGWAFAELRRALAQARLRNEAPWDAFEKLGGSLGVPELRELAASVTLAGKDGARVTASITSKARAMRAHAQARLEAEGHAASELMSVPLMLLLAGLVVFVGFPAALSIMGGLHP